MEPFFKRFAKIPHYIVSYLYVSPIEMYALFIVLYSLFYISDLGAYNILVV